MSGNITHTILPSGHLTNYLSYENVDNKNNYQLFLIEIFRFVM